MNTFLLNNWEIITSVIITPIIGFFIGKKSRKSEEKTKEADALSNVQKVYDILTDQVKSQLEALQNDLKLVKEENVEQRKDLRALQADNRDLHSEIRKLTKENEELRRIIEELRRENEQLKRNKVSKK